MPPSAPVTGVAAGVPFVAVPPATGSAAPVVLAWHLMDPPRTEAALAAELRQALARRYGDSSRVELVEVKGMGHALAEEPGIEPAPQTPAAVEVDRLAVQWLRRFLLPGSRG